MWEAAPAIRVGLGCEAGEVRHSSTLMAGDRSRNQDGAGSSLEVGHPSTLIVGGRSRNQGGAGGSSPEDGHPSDLIVGDSSRNHIVRHWINLSRAKHLSYAKRPDVIVGAHSRNQGGPVGDRVTGDRVTG